MARRAAPSSSLQVLRGERGHEAVIKREMDGTVTMWCKDTEQDVIDGLLKAAFAIGYLSAA
jgi:hypothetical protein